MLTSSIRDHLESLLALADIRIGGPNPWDVKVNDDRFFTRCMAQGSLGFGESYMEGWWECAELETMFAKIAGAGLDRQVRPFRDATLNAGARIGSWSDRDRSPDGGRPDCRLDPRLFRRMVGPTMTFSCAAWTDAKTLDEAQDRQLEAIGKRLGMRPGMRRAGHGMRLGSRHRLFRQECSASRASGLPRPTNRSKRPGKPVPDWMSTFARRRSNRIEGPFDRICSIEMIDRVPRKDLRRYMTTMAPSAQTGRFGLSADDRCQSRRCGGPTLGSGNIFFPTAIFPPPAASPNRQTACWQWKIGAIFRPTTTIPSAPGTTICWVRPQSRRSGMTNGAAGRGIIS